MRCAGLSNLSFLEFYYDFFFFFVKTFLFLGGYLVNTLCITGPKIIHITSSNNFELAVQVLRRSLSAREVEMRDVQSAGRESWVYTFYPVLPVYYLPEE